MSAALKELFNKSIFSPILKLYFTSPLSVSTQYFPPHHLYSNDMSSFLSSSTTCNSSGYVPYEEVVSLEKQINILHNDLIRVSHELSIPLPWSLKNINFVTSNRQEENLTTNIDINSSSISSSSISSISKPLNSNEYPSYIHVTVNVFKVLSDKCDAIPLLLELIEKFHHLSFIKAAMSLIISYLLLLRANIISFHESTKISLLNQSSKNKKNISIPPHLQSLMEQIQHSIDFIDREISLPRISLLLKKLMIHKRQEEEIIANSMTPPNSMISPHTLELIFTLIKSLILIKGPEYFSSQLFQQFWEVSVDTPSTAPTNTVKIYNNPYEVNVHNEQGTNNSNSDEIEGKIHSIWSQLLTPLLNQSHKHFLITSYAEFILMFTLYKPMISYDFASWPSLFYYPMDLLHPQKKNKKKNYTPKPPSTTIDHAGVKILLKYLQSYHNSCGRSIILNNPTSITGGLISGDKNSTNSSTDSIQSSQKITFKRRGSSFMKSSEIEEALKKCIEEEPIDFREEFVVDFISNQSTSYYEPEKIVKSVTIEHTDTHIMIQEVTHSLLCVLFALSTLIENSPKLPSYLSQLPGIKNLLTNSLKSANELYDYHKIKFNKQYNKIINLKNDQIIQGNNPSETMKERVFFSKFPSNINLLDCSPLILQDFVYILNYSTPIIQSVLTLCPIPSQVSITPKFFTNLAKKKEREKEKEREKQLQLAKQANSTCNSPHTYSPARSRISSLNSSTNDSNSKKVIEAAKEVLSKFQEEKNNLNKAKQDIINNNSTNYSLNNTNINSSTSQPNSNSNSPLSSQKLSPSYSSPSFSPTSSSFPIKPSMDRPKLPELYDSSTSLFNFDNSDNLSTVSTTSIRTNFFPSSSSVSSLSSLSSNNSLYSSPSSPLKAAALNSYLSERVQSNEFVPPYLKQFSAAYSIYNEKPNFDFGKNSSLSPSTKKLDKQKIKQDIDSIISNNSNEKKEKNIEKKIENNKEITELDELLSSLLT